MGTGARLPKSSRSLPDWIGDHFADGPRSAAELARPLDLHAPSLHRLMRTMASLGLLTEGEAQRFSLTKLGEALKTAAPGSAKGNPAYDRPAVGLGSGFANLLHSLQTGRTGFEKAQGNAVLRLSCQHPERRISI